MYNKKKNSIVIVYSYNYNVYRNNLVEDYRNKEQICFYYQLCCIFVLNDLNIHNYELLVLY